MKRYQLDSGPKSDVDAATIKDNSSDSECIRAASTHEFCTVKNLLAQQSVTYAADSTVIRTANMCFNCLDCKLLLKIRGKSVIQDDSLIQCTDKLKEDEEFWRQLDATINRKASQAVSNYDTMYPITRALHKNAVLYHPMMRKPGVQEGSQEVNDFPISFLNNAIQLKEVRLADALKNAASH